MSTQISTAFVNQFSANVTMLSQQMGSLLRNTVDTESVTGEKAFFDQIGSAAAAVRTTRHGDTPLMETPHPRRMVTLQDFEYADLIDDQDKIRMLSDPTSVYAKAAAAGIGRAMDDTIIAAFNASASTGKAGTTSTALPAGNVIAHGSAGLDEGSVDPSINRYIVVSPEQIEDLLNTTAVQSADFNTVKSLATGQLDSFVGFKFIVSNRLKDDGTSRQCYAWAEDGMKMAIGKEPSAQITQRADKSYATQVYYCASFGATRMEEEKISYGNSLF